GLLDSCSIVLTTAYQARRKKLGVAHDQIAIQEKQPLQRDVGIVSLVAADRRIGEIEELQRAIEAARSRRAHVDGPANSGVDGSSLVARAGELLRRPAQFFIEGAGDEQERIAQRLDFETPD